MSLGAASPLVLSAAMGPRDSFARARDPFVDIAAAVCTCVAAKNATVIVCLVFSGLDENQL